MRGALINSALMLSKLSLLIADRTASRDLQDRVMTRLDQWADTVNDVVPVSRAINGVAGAANSALDVAKGAVVTYTYPTLAAAVQRALERASAASPDPGGAYSRAWFALVDGQPWGDDLKTLPVDATVYVVNFAPYARRLEQGWHKARSQSHRPGLYITETVRQQIQQEFPDLAVQREFVSLSRAPSTNWDVPYVLRRGKLAGEPILYPAVAIKQRR